MTFQIVGLGLIAVQNDFPNFRAWPYSGANRLGLIAMHQCSESSATCEKLKIFKSFNYFFKKKTCFSKTLL